METICVVFAMCALHASHRTVLAVPVYDGIYYRSANASIAFGIEGVAEQYYSPRHV